MEIREEILRQIPPYQLGGVWKDVRPGIEKLLRKCPDTFTPEDVYWRLRNDQAGLFLVGDGFMVLETSTDTFNGQKTLWVWLLYWKSAEKNRTWLEGQLDLIAKKSGCRFVSFRSPRLGWKKQAIGYKLKLITWEREIVL